MAVELSRNCLEVLVDIETEAAMFHRRAKELRSVVAELDDIKAWFEKFNTRLRCDVSPIVTALDHAIEKVDQIKCLVGELGDVLEKEVSGG